MNFFDMYILPLIIMAVILFAAIIMAFIFYLDSKNHPTRTHRVSDALNHFEKVSPGINHVADELLSPFPEKTFFDNLHKKDKESNHSNE